MKRIRSSWLCALCLAALSSSSLVFTQSITWQQSNGPYRASVWAIAVASNDHIFVGTDGGGIFRSTNDGDTWTDIGLRGLHVLSFAFNGGGHIFAGTIFDGVFRSTDNGDTWTQMNMGLTNTGSPDDPRYTVSSLAINSNGHLFAGTGEYIQRFKGDGIFRSTDNGESWTQVSPNLASTMVPALTVSPNGNIFAGTIGKGIFRSTDGGQTWVQTGLDGIDVASLNTAPNGNIFAGINRGGVYRSTDGAIWNDTGLTNTGAGVHCVATNSRGHVFAATRGNGVFRSLNNGANWTQINSGLALAESHPKAISFNSKGQVFVCHSSGIHRSTDNGERWQPANTGLVGLRVRAIILNSAGTVFSSDGGIFRSSDLGDSWTYLGFATQCVQALVAAPNGVILAGSARGCIGNKGGVFRSSDDGRTWEELTGSLANPNIASIAINSQGHLFAGTGNAETRKDGEGIFRSTNNGESWTRINNGLTSSEVLALAITSTGAILAGTNQGLFRSADNGESWAKLNTGLPDEMFPAIAINESNRHIFVVALGRGIVRSTDNGESWTHVNQGLSNIGGVLSIAINSNSDVIAAGFNGVYYSSNEGETWTEVNAGLKNPSVSTIAASAEGYLFTGGYASSVFRSVESTTLPPDAIIITGAECTGKKLFIFGRNFDDGAVITMNGESQKTQNDDENPIRELIAKKSCKKMPRAQPVVLQVRNPDGRLSRAFSFTRR